MSAKSGPALSDSTSLTQPVTDAGQAGVNASSSALPRATATGSPCPTDGNAALAESPGQISISTTEPVGTVQVVAPQNTAAASDSAPPGPEVQEMPSSAAQVAATPPARPDGRAADELRPIQIVRPAWGSAPGRVIFCMGRTTVLCTCSVEPTVPPFLVGTGKGWLTAEYNMLPGSTAPRKARVSLKPDGRSVEIQRLIGRSLRTCLNLEKLGERTLWIDCDVLEAGRRHAHCQHQRRFSRSGGCSGGPARSTSQSAVGNPDRQCCRCQCRIVARSAYPRFELRRRQRPPWT
jgi:hypothetical protein